MRLERRMCREIRSPYFILFFGEWRVYVGGGSGDVFYFIHLSYIAFIYILLRYKTVF